MNEETAARVVPLTTPARLTYIATTSLDGFIQDDEGSIDWSPPSDDVHSFINDLCRPIGTFLFGRLMYETMVYWETAQTRPDRPANASDFAGIWQAADKIVYSKTLDTVRSAGTRLERDFDADQVRQMKATATRDINVGGSELGGQALKDGLVDDLHMFVVPIVLGGGKRYLPAGLRAKLELVDERRFAGGTVYLHYRVSR
ncbi:MAG TPA: dihydrofolate reductase family protein [Candidatus Elarobacter sp.]